MSQTIDSRVVEMKFDNKNFEKNVAESMKTLESLSKRLDNLENTQVNLDKVGRAADSLDLSKIDKALDSITHRFSIMGQIGASVLNNLTTDAYNLAKGLTSKVWGTVFGQMKTGGKARASNVENAKFLLEGMGITYSKEVEDQISDAVADTAFGFDEAAMAMAQLSGASVQLGDDMDKALKGISGVAAMTNRSFSDIADIFVDAAATGKVSADAFNRLSERGLAAKSIMQEFYGVTGEELNKLAKDGKISFNDFSKAMYDAFGTQAKKSNETLNGVLANTRAVLSRMGQSFYQPLMANNSDVVQMFNSLKTVMKGFEGPVKEIGAQLSGYVLQLARYGKGILDNIDVSKYTPMFENFKKMFENLFFAAQNFYSNILKPFGKQFKAALFEVFPSLNTGKGLLMTISDKLLELSERFRKFTADIGLFGEKGASVKDVLVAIFNAIKLVSTLLQGTVGIIKTVLSFVFSLTGGLSGAISGLTKFVSIATTVGYNIVAGISSGLLYGVSAIIGAVINIGHVIIDAFCSFFGIHSPSRLMITMVGIPIVLGIAAGILKGFPEVKIAIFNVLSGIIGLVGQIIGTVLTGVSKITVNVFKILFNTITNVINAFANAVNRVNTAKLKEIFDFIKNIVLIAAELYIIFRVVSAVDNAAKAVNNFAKAAKAAARSFELFSASFTIKHIGDMIGKFANIFKWFALLMATLTGSIILIASMWKNNYAYELIGAMGMIMLLAATMTGLIKEITKIDSEQLKSAALTFAGFGAAMWAMGTGIKKLGKMKWPEILTAVVSMGIVIGALAYLAYKLRDGEAWYSQINYKLILAFAGGVWLIATSIKKLGKMDPADLWKAETAIIALIAVFGLISIGLTEASKLHNGDLSDGQFKQMALAFLAFGIAIKTVSKVVVALGFIKPEKLEQGMLVVSQIMALMAALMLAAHFVATEVTGLLLAMSVMVGVMAAAIKILGDMKTGIGQGLGILTLIMVEIATFIGVVAKINPDFKAMTSLAFVAAMLMAMTGTIKWLGEMDWRQLLQGAAALTVLIAALTGIIYLWSKFTGLINGQNTFQVAIVNPKEKKKQEENKKAVKERIKYIKTIINAVAELALVAATVAKMVKTPQEIAIGLGFLAAAFVGIMFAIGAIAKVGGDKDKSLKGMASAIRSIALVVLAIGASLILLSNMPMEGVLLGAAAIGVILGIIGAVILPNAKVFGVQGMDYKGILAAAAAIAAIGIALSAMTFFSGGEGGLARLEASAISLAGVILAIGFALKAADKVKINPKTGLAFLAASTSIFVIAGAVVALNAFGVDWKTAAADILALGSCIVAIGFALKLAGNIKWTAIVGLLAGATAMVGVAFALWLIADYKWQELLPSFMALVGIVTILAGILAALSLLADTGIGAAGIVIVAASIAILSASLVGMSIAMGIAVQALTQFISLFNPETANNILGFFTTLGDGMGEAAKKVMDGITETVKVFREGIAALKEESGNAGSDFVGGFAAGILSNSPLVLAAAVALGALAIFGLRSKDGIDSHSNSKKTIEAGKDFDGGLGEGIASNAALATGPAKDLGSSIVGILQGSLSEGVKNLSIGDYWNGIKSEFSGNNNLKWYEWFGAAGNSVKRVISGITKTYAQGAVTGVQNGISEAVSSATSGEGGGIMSLFSGLTSGNFDNLLSGFDFSKVLGEGGIGELKNYLSDAGASMDVLSGDNIPKLIEQLKGAGLASDDLINALKELGITEDQLKDLGLADKLGLDTAKEGAEELKTTIQDLADEIIKGKFGNAPERWDRMFEALIKSGKTAEEAYAAIADAQNEVNKRLGSSVVHTADEMEKKVSDSAKKAAGVASKATGKPAKDFTKEPHKAVTGITKADAKSSAEEQMKNNMPYANYLAAKEQQITGERQKQTAEVYKQKLANEHMYTLKEKEQAMAGLKANQELAANATLSTEKQKQLDAENKKYQAVVDTYNKQQDMLKVIQEQEAATKKAEDAEKKRGDAIKASSGAVVYGTQEYENQKKGVTINNRKTIVKQETKPVQAETKVEVTPKLEVKNVDVTNLKTNIINKVEAEVKELNTKVDITPKIDTSKAETQIANFKQKTNELKTSIPETFNGIAQKVSEHFTKISSMVIQGGGKLTSNTRAVFQNAVSAATGVLTGSATISKFYNAGKQAATGYVNGIKSQAASVKTASANLGNNSAKTVKQTLGIKSPSRVFMQIGEYAGEGYVVGIQSYMGAVETASQDLSQSSIDGVYRVVDAVQNAVNNGMDLTPTITPVFDSVNVQNGLGDVNSMMDLSQRDIASISANIDAKASYDNSQVEAMQARMSDMQTAFNNLADILSNQETPIVEANVNLMGDANGVFKLVQDSNNRYTKMHGRSAFA